MLPTLSVSNPREHAHPHRDHLQHGCGQKHSEGRGEAANINGQKESDVASIQSAATRNSLKIEGEADAEAARIYAAAFNSPEAQGLYSFVRRLEVARYGFSQGTTAVISTESDFGNVLKGIGGAGIVPAPTPSR